MVQPTPWRANETQDRNGMPEPAASGTGPKAYQVALRGYWGYVAAAVGNLVTFILLFQAWMTVRGPDGSVSVNAFGRMQISTVYLNIWSSQRPRSAQITGIWALLASAAITVTVLAVVINLRLRIEALARLTTLSTLVTALFVLITVLHINSNAPQLRAMVTRTTDLGGQIGSFMNWAFGNGKLAVPGMGQATYASATLTQWALLAGFAALVSAVAAVTQWIRNGSKGLFRLPMRIRVITSEQASEADSDK
ncbi:hypothetical protein [Nocardia amamiensis]|uniref:hypothetical protein n=1 Tax=Nocardia TaxID=1817 RepID=UPI0033F06ECB